MSGELITQQSMFQWAADTMRQFSEIRTFQDIERVFLRDQGLSGNTYAAYAASVKSCYTFLDGKHPLQWTPGELEAFYDDERRRNGISTALLRMAGLKNFTKTIQAKLPFWPNPFDIMNEATKRKLATPARAQQKSALYGEELRAVLAHLKGDLTLKGKQNLAIVLTLFSTGLRAQELCDLTGSSLEHDTDTDKWTLRGIGKGSKPYSQEIHPEAVAALLDAFQAQFGRKPRADDALFTSLESYKGKKPSRLTKAVLWIRLHDIGETLKAAGSIRREIEFSAHLFRRSYLTLLSKAGMSLRAIQGISRHANIETLAKHYVDDTVSSKTYLDKIMGISA